MYMPIFLILPDNRPDILLSKKGAAICTNYQWSFYHFRCRI